MASEFHHGERSGLKAIDSGWMRHFPVIEAGCLNLNFFALPNDDMVLRAGIDRLMLHYKLTRE
jgi:hypothetical protein